MKKTLIALGLVMMVAATASARPHRHWRRPAKRFADKNKDGVVDRKERKITRHQVKRHVDKNHDGVVDRHERRLAWRKTNRKVNTPLEKKYDANGDGVIGPKEARNLLHDKWILIRTRGKAKVDTETEKAYDTNGDGWIGPKEAVQMKADLGN